MDRQRRISKAVGRLLALTALVGIGTAGIAPGAGALPDPSAPRAGTEATTTADPVGESSSPTGGVLDPAFGGDGRVESNPTAGDDYARDLVIQADGKIVVAGAVGGGHGQFGVLRYRTDGTLDPTFSGNGWVATDFSNGYDEAQALALQPDGRIVVAGYSDPGRIALARYRTNGTLDSTFSGDGRVTTLVGTDYAVATGVALQPDGRIVIVGETGGNGGRVLLARYSAGGRLDRTFSGDGWATVDFSPIEDFLWDLALQPDGRIVGVGVARGGRNATDPTIAVVRFRTTGTPDPTFSGDGLARISLGGRPELGLGVALQPDGGILIAGEYGHNRGGAFAVARLLPAGNLDTAFGTLGRTITDFTTGEDYAWDVAVQSDGGIVLAGVSRQGAGSFGIARYGADGSPDPSFDGDGRLATDFTGQFDGALAVGIQGDGAIVAAGGSAGAPGKVALARYLG